MLQPFEKRERKGHGTSHIVALSKLIESDADRRVKREEPGYRSDVGRVGRPDPF